MKKIIGLAVILLFGLTGCISNYELTEEQAGIITEYASSVVLKYDRAYADKLTDTGKPEVTVTEDEKTGESETPETNGSSEGSNSSSSTGASAEEGVAKEPAKASLTKVIGKSGFTIKYNSYALYDSYPKNAKGSAYLVSAPKNGKLLIAEVTVKNTTSAKKKFNTMSDKWEMSLDSAKDDVISVSYSPAITFLSNTLQYADTTIEAGKSKKMIVVFEVPTKGNYDNYTLSVKNGDLISGDKLK